MSSEQVLELSVEDTNRLRAKLGLAPLRTGESASQSPKTNEGAAVKEEEEVLELSVDATNDLRASLGLAPLNKSKDGGSSGSKDHHTPAVNQGDVKEAAERVEKSKLKRQVEQGLSKFNSSSLADEEKEGSLLSWAQQMRTKKEEKKQKKADKKKEKSQKAQDYDEHDLNGLNVAHSLGELEGGSTTVLTLADTELLQVNDASKRAVGLNDDPDESQVLENVNLSEQQKQRDGLKEKRQMELGMGRAGGYAGFDDDEFVELGGTQGPSRMSRDDFAASKSSKKKRKAGFQIGAMLEEQEEQESDIFAGRKGKAISLLESSQDGVGNGDFMSMAEDEEVNKKKKKKKKDDTKFKKNKKKKDKKEKKQHKRRTALESDDEEDGAAPVLGSGNLLEDLEQTAKADPATQHVSRKRRHSNDEEDENMPDQSKSVTLGDDAMQVDEDEQKRSKYAAIMAKGNERTKLAFSKQAKSKAELTMEDEEPDDAFLNAALSKARRMNRLKQLAASSGAPRQAKGEDAVLEAVRSTAFSSSAGTHNDAQTSSNSMVFSVDETREFTRALRAREEQSERTRAKANKKEELPVKEEEKPIKQEAEEEEEETDAMEIDDANLKELAKEIEVPDDGATAGLDGSTASTVAIGRGLGGVLNILKQTGEITKKNAGREELRGRAKDERNYEDYEPLDLSKVVQVDQRTATDKDKEFSKREVKLEYRDKHGRLLTRKEAFRDLSYQFHGYGSGKRKEEKKLQQIAREQAEQRFASQQAAEGGILGALKATQKATGKAFVVHKTS